MLGYMKEVGAKERILVVDDDESTCKTLSLIFKKKGYEVETAGTGREAIEKSRERLFNVVLLDIKLPDVEGVDLITPLKETHPDLEVMMITGNATMEAAVRALNYGASAFVTKPLNIDDVLARLKLIIEKQRLVVEKQRIDKEIKRAYSELDQLFNISVPLCVIDKEFNIVRINSSFSSTFQLNKYEIVRKKCYDILPGQFCNTLECSIRQVLAGKNRWIYEKDINLNNGKTITTLMRAVPYKSPDGEIEGVIENYTNITNRKIAEEKLKESEGQLKLLSSELEMKVELRTQELKESEEKFRTITEQSLMGICITQDNEIKYVNEKYTDMWGYTVEKMMTWGIRDVIKAIHPDDREHVLEQFAKKQRDERDVDIHYQYRGIKKSGAVIWVEQYSKPIIYRGRPADLITIIDISERKKAEYNLIESEEKFRTITEQSVVGIIIVQDDLIIYFNQQLSYMFGFTKEEINEWKSEDWLKLIHPDCRELVQEAVKRNQLGDKKFVFHSELEGLNKYGETFWVDFYSRSIIYQGRPASMNIIIDITEKKMAEELIIEQNKKLLELQEIRKDLITKVSHELKTPLTSIYGATQILLKFYREEMSEKVQRYFEIEYKGCIRLKELINNLLDTSRLEAKKFELKLQEEHLARIVKECVDDLMFLASDRELTVKLDLQKDLYLNVDKFRLEQAITNLVSNAIKNTPSGGEIQVGIIKKNDSIDIIVKDTGIGLTKQEQEKIFQKFGKIERYGTGEDLGVDLEGTGLGLYISKEIVKFHGGKILVESEGRNKGATFIIRLPIY